MEFLQELNRTGSFNSGQNAQLQALAIQRAACTFKIKARPTGMVLAMTNILDGSFAGNCECGKIGKEQPPHQATRARAGSRSLEKGLSLHGKSASCTVKLIQKSARSVQDNSR